MKTIKLTQGQVAIVDDIDYDFLMQWKWCASWDGWHYRPVRGVWSDGKTRLQLMYQVIAERMGLDAKVIDHKDRDPLNNCRSNLRAASTSQNGHNRTAQKNSKTGVKGIYLDNRRDRYYGQIQVRGRSHFAGYHETISEAAIALDKLRQELVGEFATA